MSTVLLHNDSELSSAPIVHSIWHTKTSNGAVLERTQVNFLKSLFNKSDFKVFTFIENWELLPDLL